jgi:hypothetical protein
MKARKLTINVGLNNNPKFANQIARELNGFLFDRYSWRVENGQYNKETEPTLVIQGETLHDLQTIQARVKALCIDLTQECIPFELASYGELVYNDQYSGDRYSFDKNYFIKILG